MSRTECGVLSECCETTSRSSMRKSISYFPPVSRTSKALCVITAGVAFVLGTVVGIMIPFYILPSSSNSSSNQDVRTSSVWPQNEVVTEETGGVKFVSSSNLIETSTRGLSARITNSGRYSQELVDGIFWSDAVEELLPAGFDDFDVESWREFCRRSPVVKIEEGCGRMQNRLITFENGTRSCCRYRQNFDQIQGEIFSFHLSRILGIKNLPPAALALVKPRSWQWSSVRSQLSLAQWAEDRPVVLTRFLDHLEPAFIPEGLRSADRRMHPIDLVLRGLDLSKKDELSQLAQWSDLIVFDYLTANLDRIVNNLYNMQWNAAMMEAPAHNLARDPNSGLLVFLDNESGLLHGYRLLEKYEQYHRTMLDALCIYRKETVRRIKQFHDEKNIGEVLRRTFRGMESDFVDFLPMLPDRSIRILNNRIEKVYEQITKCEDLYVT